MAFAALAIANGLGARDHDQPGDHAATPEAMEAYKAEPYAMAADVYAVAPHTGRGGWSWYTARPDGCTGWLSNRCWA